MRLNNFVAACLTAGAAVALVLGAASPSMAAKAKKKEAAPAQPMAICPFVYQPVCAVKGGQKYTYSNSCFAQKDGAKVVSQGACKAGKPAMGKKSKAGKKAKMKPKMMSKPMPEKKK